ncbi:MAG TPA: DNA-processing protein DprA, partial [Candidatus Eisenbacteria bacterium]|nr:DNA-processing protein DprA [Candidatus Eisenbacteria bacterium]
MLADPDAHADLLSVEALALLRRRGEAERKTDEERRRAAALGVRIVARDEPDFPALVAQIFDPPPVLYVRGRLHAEDVARGVAIVG